MTFLNAQTAEKSIAYTPSNLINNAIKGFGNKAKLEADKQAAKVVTDAKATVAESTFATSAAKGFRKGLDLSSAAATAAIATAAIGSGSLILPVVGNVLSCTSATLSVFSHFASPYADDVIKGMFNRAKGNNPNMWMALGLACKLGALVLFEIPRLSFAAVNIAAAIVCGTAGAVLGGIGHFIPGRAAKDSAISDAVVTAPVLTETYKATAEAELAEKNRATKLTADEDAKAEAEKPAKSFADAVPVPVAKVELAPALPDSVTAITSAVVDPKSPVDDTVKGLQSAPLGPEIHSEDKKDQAA